MEQCNRCSMPMVRFGPEETGIYTFVCPLGHMIMMKRNTKTFIVTLPVQAYYDNQRKQHFAEWQPQESEA